MKPLINKEIIASIVKIVSTKLPDCKILLFGSRAKKNERVRSDYDIALLWKKTIPAENFYLIKDEIENMQTLKTVDLMDFNKLDEVFQKIVLKEGKIIYDGTK